MGDFKDSKRHGIGSLLTGPGGSVLYNGSWLCGVYHGDGLLIKYIENTCMKAKSRRPSPGFRGNKEAPMIQYKGSFVNGLRHGFGTFKSTIDNYEYHGEWHKDVPISGRWRISIDGSIYSGEAMVADDKEAENDTDEDYTKGGANSITRGFDSGKVRSGSAHHTGSSSFENEVMKFPQAHGFGTMKYKNGDVYVGQFEKGEGRFETYIVLFNQIL
jgi:hypothetical protein